MFSALNDTRCWKYDMISFDAGETILLEVRKHWLGIVVHGVVLCLLAIIPFLIVLVVLPYFFPDILAATYLFYGALWMWFVWVMFFVMWTNYYLDVVVITNKRLIDMEQFVLFSRDEVVIPLASVEDIKIEVKGIFATMLHYGNLQIQTAGAARETIMKHIMRPERALACLQEAVSKMNKSDTSV